MKLWGVFFKIYLIYSLLFTVTLNVMNMLYVPIL